MLIVPSSPIRFNVRLKRKRAAAIADPFGKRIQQVFTGNLAYPAKMVAPARIQFIGNEVRESINCARFSFESKGLAHVFKRPAQNPAQNPTSYRPAEKHAPAL